ncbi:hypothetical protein [Paenibacillus sp. HJGM_3]|uniref:hypothetical protein n=1 Tax=Paenibacillus sp. HJGM_3 TaxID=3379816 RepID=UPI003857FC37
MGIVDLKAPAAANPCLQNQLDFVYGTINSAGTSYTVLDLAKWVSYQSYLSPYHGSIPISFVLCHWPFEIGWSITAFESRYNPGNQGALCGYSGTSDGTPPGTSFVSAVHGDPHMRSC